MDRRELEFHLERHVGLSFDESKLYPTVAAIIWEDEPERLKSMLIGDKAMPFGVRISQAPEDVPGEGLRFFLHVSIEGTLTVACRLKRVDKGRWSLGHVVRSPGRPTKSPEASRTVTFRLRLTPSERESLDAQAEATGQTPSQFLRGKITTSIDT